MDGLSSGIEGVSRILCWCEHFSSVNVECMDHADQIWTGSMKSLDAIAMFNTGLEGSDATNLDSEP